jgi:adenosylmethionine-8-amino-7-oxononanoate aminotransferase
MGQPQESAVLSRHLGHEFLNLARAKGIRVEMQDGQTIIDASGGAAVACIGHADARVREAMVAQLDKAAYCSTIFYTTDVCEQLCEELVRSTHGHMSRAYIVCSGT